ncbi:MAG: hypothetical protein HY558_03400 [Euryarchaeota archaeon]|nr:hypothetical protein [Euryarchaeota archaeon]
MTAAGRLPLLPPGVALRLYLTGLLLYLPGEAAAPLFLGYREGWSVAGFQTLMVLSDGVGVLLLSGAIGLLLGEAEWFRGNRWREGLILSSAGGLVIALVTENLGAHLWNLWTYPPGLPTLLGASLGAVAGWLVLPPAVFYLVHTRWSPHGLLLSGGVVAGATLAGLRFLA